MGMISARSIQAPLMIFDTKIGLIKGEPQQIERIVELWNRGTVE